MEVFFGGVFMGLLLIGSVIGICCFSIVFIVEYFIKPKDEDAEKVKNGMLKQLKAILFIYVLIFIISFAGCVAIKEAWNQLWDSKGDWH